jgi:pyrroline-5-carboxylate reductase
MTHRTAHADAAGHLGAIGFIGAGNMAEAILSCIADRSYVVASRRSVNALRALEERYGIKTTTDNREVVRRTDTVFICVKPQGLDALLEEIGDIDFSQKLVISILAGKPISAFAARLKNCTRVVRAMPNLGLLVGKGATAYALSEGCLPEDAELAHTLLNAGAIAMRVDEGDIDTITALSGCGPAFLSFFFSAMQNAAIANGLDPAVAKALLFQTIAGTYEYLRQHDAAYEEFIAKVASKGGATRAGLDAGEGADICGVIAKMMDAAIARSRELGS